MEVFMSIFDVLKSGSLGSTLETLTNQAKSTASDVQKKTPGGLGGLLGAGALGALLANVVSSDVVKNAALVGAGAVAWNFYQKWSSGNQAIQTEQAAAPVENPMTMNFDPTAELVMRAMIFAARADGNIDAIEQQRIDTILQNMLRGQDVSGKIHQMQQETLDPAKIAAQVHSPEQGEDIYRLSCVVIDIDHFMERSYMDVLAKSLNISDTRKTELETEAGQARQQLVSAIQQ